MVVLEAGYEALAGNCRTLIPQRGETLREGDRVELVCPGSAASSHGIVIGEQGGSWLVWVSG